MRSAEFPLLPDFCLIIFPCRKRRLLMKKKGLFSVVQLVGFVLLLALLVSCPGSPDIKDEGGSPPPHNRGRVSQRAVGRNGRGRC